MRTADPNEQRKVHAALNRAIEVLETTLREQETAAVRILGLAERIYDNSVDPPTRIQAEAIMEACTFQDITGQKIQKVVRFVKYLRDNGIVEASDLPEVAKSKGLTQSDVDRLLKGGKPIIR